MRTYLSLAGVGAMVVLAPGIIAQQNNVQQDSNAERTVTERVDSITATGKNSDKEPIAYPKAVDTGSQKIESSTEGNPNPTPVNPSKDELANPHEAIRNHLDRARNNFDPNTPDQAADELYRATVLLTRQIAISDSFVDPMMKEHQQGDKKMTEEDYPRGAGETAYVQPMGEPVRPAPDVDPHRENRDPNVRDRVEERERFGNTSPSTTQDIYAERDRMASKMKESAETKQAREAISQLEEFNQKIRNREVEDVEAFRKPYSEVYRAMADHCYSLAVKLSDKPGYGHDNGHSTLRASRSERTERERSDWNMGRDTGDHRDAMKTQTHEMKSSTEQTAEAELSKAPQPVHLSVSKNSSHHAAQAAAYLRDLLEIEETELDPENDRIVTQFAASTTQRDETARTASRQNLRLLGERLQEHDIDVELPEEKKASATDKVSEHKESNGY